MPYDSNCHCQVNFGHRIDALLNETEEPLEDYFWDVPDISYPWNLYWTDTARQGGGLSINDPVFADRWTRYKGLHVDCKDQEVCYCKHNCRGIHMTIGRAAAALSSIVTAIYHWNWWMPSDSVPLLFHYVIPRFWSLITYVSHPAYEPSVQLQGEAEARLHLFHTTPFEQFFVVL